LKDKKPPNFLSSRSHQLKRNLSNPLTNRRASLKKKKQRLSYGMIQGFTKEKLKRKKRKCVRGFQRERKISIRVLN
jgi:hypothetical protein